MIEMIEPGCSRGDSQPLDLGQRISIAKPMARRTDDIVIVFAHDIGARPRCIGDEIGID